MRADVDTWARLWVDAPDGIPDVTGLRRTVLEHEDGTLYLERYHLLDTPGTSIRLHHWHTGDDDRAPHDHPWDNATAVLAGTLVEYPYRGTRVGYPRRLDPGAVVVRQAIDPHRVELRSDDAWTLFVTGPIVRPWGFHTPTGWVHWTRWPGAGRYRP